MYGGAPWKPWHDLVHFEPSRVFVLMIASWKREEENLLVEQMKRTH